jgi:hypothetical protein
LRDAACGGGGRLTLDLPRPTERQKVIHAREWQVEDLPHCGRSMLCNPVGQVFDLPGEPRELGWTGTPARIFFRTGTGSRMQAEGLLSKAARPSQPAVEVIHAREWQVGDLPHCSRSMLCNPVGQVFDLPGEPRVFTEAVVNWAGRAQAPAQSSEAITACGGSPSRPGMAGRRPAPLRRAESLYGGGCE